MFYLSPDIALSSESGNASSDNIPSAFLSLEESGPSSFTWLNKGKILYRLQAWAEASAAFSKTGIDAPADILEEALYLRANSLFKSGDYPGAFAQLNLIPAKSRFYQFGLYTRAMISLETKREKDASEYLEQIYKNYPDSSLTHKSHITLGFISLENKNSSEAIRHFIAIPESSPFYPQALFGMGWAYAMIGRWVRTVVFWEELSSKYPDSHYTREIMIYTGHAYTTLSAYGKALEQNGIALRYYTDLISEITTLEDEIKVRNINTLAKGAKILGTKELTDEIDLYEAHIALEEYLMKKNKETGSSSTETLIKSSIKKRAEISDRLSLKVVKGLEDLKHQLSKVSLMTSLEISRNLRAEGGGQISKDMIFNYP